MGTTPLTGPQQTVQNIEQGILTYLTPSTQALVGVAQAIGTPNEDAISKTLQSISVLTQVAGTIPNPTVQAYAGLAAVIEQLVADGIGAIANATKPTTIVANAHPSFVFKFFHPNIAKQEQTLAAQTPVTPAISAPLPTNKV